MANKTISFELQGADQLRRALKALGSVAVRAAGASLYQSAEEVMTRSREDFCPIDTGALKSTGTVGLPDIEGTNVTVELGYGGPSVDYAVAVHETDKNYRNGKQWKYLETPLKEAIPDINNKLVEDLNDAMEKV